MKVMILLVCTLSYALEEVIYLPGSSTKTTHVKIPEILVNMERLELNIVLSDPDDDGTGAICDSSSHISGVGEIEGEEEGEVAFSSLEVYSPIEHIEVIKIYTGNNNKCIYKKLCLEKNYFPNGKTVPIKITSSLPFDKTVKFTLRTCSDDSNTVSLVAIFVRVTVIIVLAITIVILYKKYHKVKEQRSLDDKPIDPESQKPLMDKLGIELKQLPETPSAIRIEVLDPQIHQVGKERYTDYELRLPSQPGCQDQEFSVRRRFEDFKLLSNELESCNKIEKEKLPPIPHQDNPSDDIFESNFIEKKRSELEDFINKIASVALTERCVQSFLQKSTIDRMDGQFKMEMKECHGFNDLLKALQLNPKRVRISNAKFPCPTQTILQNCATGEISIVSVPTTELWEGFWTGWVACSNSPSFQLGCTWKETTIYGRETMTTARIEDNKLIKIQTPEDPKQPITVETREMVDDNTMKMKLAIPDRLDIIYELIFKRVASYDMSEEAIIAENDAKT